MSNAMMEVKNGSKEPAAVIVRPSTTIGFGAEQARAQAEIQSALTVASARPRDEIGAIDRIKNACQRHGLAEKSEYSYSRGGTEITGPTIDLLTVIACYWGNLMHGFRELSETPSECTVESYAWDLESNTKKSIVFTVQHKRTTKQGSYLLTDPRDRYENLANMAQRRVRKCLEDVIPSDVVEDAVLQCRATLAETAEVNEESIGKVVSAFGRIGVTKDQLQKRLGRRMDAMQPSQLVSLRRIYKSISDGMSDIGDWFESPQEEKPSAPKTAADTAKEALKARTAPKPTAETTQAPQADSEPVETPPVQTQATEAKKPAAKGKKAAAVTVDSLVEYIKKTFDRDHGDFDLEKLAAAALAMGGDHRAFFADVIGRKHDNFEHFLIEDLQEQEGDEEEGEEVDEAQDGPDEILSPVPRPAMDMFGDTFEKRIITKLKTPEELREFANHDLKDPDLKDQERAYLTSLALRRAYQIENGLPLTDKIAK